MVSERRVRLVVVYGGRSAEHEVSCVSARHVVSAVDPDRYELRLVGITTAGGWVDMSHALEPGGAAEGEALPSPDGAPQDRALPSPSPLGSAFAPVPIEEPAGAQTVVLPLVHGPMGEDGTLQGLLEMAGVPYCGAGVAGSAAAMDKGLAKSLLASACLPQARWLQLHESEIDGRVNEEVGSRLGWPVFVKPANMGSSIGITKVGGPDGLRAAVEEALRYDDRIVVEEAVEGRELEIGVLGWPSLRTSVPGEVKPSHEFYDYSDKYLEGSAGLEIPAQLPPEVAAEMSRLAVAACRALRVDSMARVDFFYEPGRGLLVNEVNTIPGFTPISMFPALWQASGLSYADLVGTLVDQALRRAERRRRFETGR